MPAIRSAVLVSVLLAGCGSSSSSKPPATSAAAATASANTEAAAKPTESAPAMAATPSEAKPPAAAATASTAAPATAPPVVTPPPLPDLPALSTEQRAQIQAFHKRVQSEVAPLRQELQLKRQELRAAWSADAPQREAILTKLAELDTLRQKIRQIAVDERLAIIAMLTPEQRAAAKARRTQHVARQGAPDLGWGMGMGQGMRNMNMAAGVDDCPGLDDAAHPAECGGCMDGVDTAMCMATITPTTVAPATAAAPGMPADTAPPVPPPASPNAPKPTAQAPSPTPPK